VVKREKEEKRGTEMPVTKEQTKSALKMILAVSETIREAGRIPSGTLYAVLMGKVDMAGYTKMIDILKRAGLVEEKFHELIWVGGPRLERR
jgi:hypothetical protein